LPPGLLARSLERAGCVPLPLDRKNPTRSFRQMLKILSSGGMLYVLMDQANKGEGAPRRLLGKTLRMPSGIPSLAVRTGTPVLPVHAEAAAPEWRFRVYPPLVADTSETMLDAMMDSMQAQIIRYPALWSWHHRRWRRYHFDS
jgi:KDO2-lipid IV(A) lauroyltransferase